jgi:hypothetical protein
MKNSTPQKLVCLTICLYASCSVGMLYPLILQRISGVNDDTLLSSPSRFAQSNQALMVFVQVAAAVMEIVFNRKHSRRSSYFGVIQSSLLILYFGLLTYDMFLGSMCLHHGPHFSPSEFVRYGFGVYPVAIFLVVLSAFLIRQENKKQKTEPNK